MKKPTHKYVSRRVRAANAARAAQKNVAAAWERLQEQLAAANAATKNESGWAQPSAYLKWWNECPTYRDPSPHRYYGEGREPEWASPLYRVLENLAFARQHALALGKGQSVRVPLYYNNYSGDGGGIRNHLAAWYEVHFAAGTPREVVEAVSKCSANWLGHILLLKAGGSRNYMGGSWESDPSRWLRDAEIVYIKTVASRCIIAMV